VKRAWDPDGLLNPGKLFPAPDASAPLVAEIRRASRVPSGG